mmetsp:Transcript_12816/g.40916  ORF Transcript_12816/g.40916 Transcript_12816/m.40916 type:complete len:284 (+) Transcript_12816:504-1355(+)|eukprot:CAMPEP_0196769124 /NCGR_PEP_ID=MMETSP1104-20130614/346_1 /TAXON_ID=33652 /ORGANISM="Cafeteria sp., Strain Caron Lab Isolate" /LENGTH=283 /DNA_ID=CAMNT_0042139209 /DNA_START=13 /DNA_END=864 /DNA_ORIENTATION=+
MTSSTAPISIVTGGGTGIGRALALQLSSHGRRVLICGRRLEPLVETQKLGSTGTIEWIQCDVSTSAGAEAILSRVKELEGRVAHLVQNAAILGPVDRISDVDMSQWQKTFDINVHGPLRLVQTLLPHFDSGARILHISSGAAHSAIDGWGAYCCSKAAFHMLYQILRSELGRRGLLVGSVRPGVVDTPMQAVIRGSSEDAFPALARFKSLHEHSRGAAEGPAPAGAGAEAATAAPPPKDGLDSPANVGVFLRWLLCSTSDEEFAAAEWDVRDAAHFHRWASAE